VKSSHFTKWLEENGIVDKHGNDYNLDDVVRYLRNGLAHFNIKVNGDEGKIENVRITAKNLKERPICKQPCDNPRCVPRQFTKNNGSICTFSFSVDQLVRFMKLVINDSLMDHEIMRCEDCPHTTPDG